MWFGYSFSLFCGAILWWVVFQVYKKGHLSTGLGFVWGVCSALSLYELPISFPIVISSLLSICCIILYNTEIRWNNFYYKIFTAFFFSGLLFALVIFLLFLFPYWIKFLDKTSTDAVGFLAEGRNLLPPKVQDEHPLFDRFLQECLPTLFGSRAPFDQQHSANGILLPSLPTLLFLFGLVSLPFSLGNRLRDKLHRSLSPIHIPLWLLALGTVFLVSFSPFGIWPWYAIPIYISTPILLYFFFHRLWYFCPAVSIGAFVLYTLSLSTSVVSYSALYQQPLSLAIQGHSLETDFSKVQSILKENDIRYSICEQGYDSWSNISGKDWIGECLYFDSDLQLFSIDRLSRRDLAAVQEIMNSDRVAYVFHKDFFFSPPADDSETGIEPISLSSMDKLFSSKHLDFKRYETPHYVVYIPPKNTTVFRKGDWKLKASNQAFLSAAVDNNLSVRLQSSDTYWSSGPISNEGVWFQIDFPTRLHFSKVILFHGSKAVDHPTNSQVFLLDEQGIQYNVGTLTYDQESKTSSLNLYYFAEAKGLLIKSTQPYDERWFTIVEIWIR